LDYSQILDSLQTSSYAKFLISLVFVLLLQLPVCTIESFAQLHILSLVGAFMLFYVVLVSIFEFPFYFKKYFQPEKVNYFNLNVNIFQTFCVFFFAFGNHTSILNVLYELKDKTTARIKMLVNYTYYLEFSLYLVVMLVGYFSTLDQTNEIYIDRPGQSIFMVIGKVLYALCMVCNIGLYYYMIRPNLEYLFNKSQTLTTRQYYNIIY
jgi:amino acid permease